MNDDDRRTRHTSKAEDRPSNRLTTPCPSAQVGLVETEHDLEGILALQRACRAPTPDGFVTVVHTLDILRAMHALMPSIVARDVQGQVVGYALAMPRETRSLLPILEPMFALIDDLDPSILCKAPNPRWYVMGQIAIAPAYRGTGLFDALYEAHQSHYRDRFDVIITDVATRNLRSMRAHQRVGFHTVAIYRDATDEWATIAWDWTE